MSLIVKKFFAPDWQFGFDSFYGFCAGINSCFAMCRRSKHKKTYFTGGNFAEAMMDVHAREWIFLKNFLPQLMHFFQCHLFVSSIFNRRYFPAILFISAYLP